MVVPSVGTAVRWVGGIAGATVAAALIYPRLPKLMGLAYCAIYPRRPKLKGLRFPTAGRAFVRWKGGPQVYILYPATETSGGVQYFSNLVIDALCIVFKTPRFLWWFAQQKSQNCHRGVPMAIADASSDGKFPVLIFSHGLFAGAEFYQILCTSLARSGYVVIAVEHEDATNLCVLPEGADAPLFIQPAPPEFQMDEKRNCFTRESVIEFRRPFLQKRDAELQFLLRAIAQGSGGPVSSSDIEHSLLEQIMSRVDKDNVWMSGHSFGACSCLVLARELQLASKDASRAQGLQLRGCLLFDMWGKPLAREVDAADDWEPCPQLILVTEDFVDTSIYKSPCSAEALSFAKKMRSRAAAAGCSAAVVGPFLLRGAEHQSFMDQPYLGPTAFQPLMPKGIQPNHRDVILQSIVDASVAFMQFTRQGGKAGSPSHFQAFQDELLADPVLAKHGF